MKTTAMIQFKIEGTDGEGAGKFRLFSLVVENVFRIEAAGPYTHKLYYNIPGATNTKCMVATINWLMSTSGIDVNKILWDYVTRANNNPGSCETVYIPNSDGGELWSSGLIFISQENLPTA